MCRLKKGRSKIFQKQYYIVWKQRVILFCARYKMSNLNPVIVQLIIFDSIMHACLCLTIMRESKLPLINILALITMLDGVNKLQMNK